LFGTTRGSRSLTRAGHTGIVKKNPAA